MDRTKADQAAFDGNAKRLAKFLRKGWITLLTCGCCHGLTLQEKGSSRPCIHDFDGKFRRGDI